MKKIFGKIRGIVFPAAVLFLVSSCKKEIYQQQQTQNASDSKIDIPDQIHVLEPRLYPEGVAFDKINNRFLVGSFDGPIGSPYWGTNTIGAVSFNGEYTPLINDADLETMLGLHIDETHKRIVVAVQDGWLGDAAKVAAYDLMTGKRIWLTDLGSLYPGGIHLADDLAIDPQGNSYITDAKAPVVYKVDVNGHASVFFEDSAFATPAGFPYYWVGFNGIVYDNNGSLIVAFYAGSFVGKPSLIKIPIKDPQQFNGIQLDFPVASPDGLLLSRDGRELVIVDNKFGVPPSEIVHMSSNDDWRSAKRIESFVMGSASGATTAASDGTNVFVIDGMLSVPDPSEFIIQKMPFKFKSF